MSKKNKQYNVSISREFVGEDDECDLGMLFAVRSTHETCYTDAMLKILVGTPEKERVQFLKTLPPIDNEPLLMLAMFVSDWMFRAKSSSIAKKALKSIFNPNVFNTLPDDERDWFGQLLLMTVRAGAEGVDSLVSFSIVEQKVFEFYLNESLKETDRANASEFLVALDSLGDHDKIKKSANVPSDYFQITSANDEAG
jgi:hypothetical protein